MPPETLVPLVPLATWVPLELLETPGEMVPRETEVTLETLEHPVPLEHPETPEPLETLELLVFEEAQEAPEILETLVLPVFLELRESEEHPVTLEHPEDLEMMDELDLQDLPDLLDLPPVETPDLLVPQVPLEPRETEVWLDLLVLPESRVFRDLLESVLISMIVPLELRVIEVPPGIPENPERASS